MVLTKEEADALLALPKIIMLNNIPQENYSLDSTSKIDVNIPLQSFDGRVLFLLHVFQGNLDHLKISLHCQHEPQHVALLRVDYKGRHKNPEIATDDVPPELQAFCGADIWEPHIHYYVQGYKPLAWAVPLSASSFPVKEIKEIHDFQSALDAFCATINLKTKVNCDGRLFL